MAKRKLSPRGAALVKAFECCHKRDGNVYKPYLCPAGVLTIGWGHTNHHGRPFDKTASWTQQECDDAFAEDMDGFEQQVTALVKVPLKQHQFDALVSFAYNVGVGNLRSSTLLRKLNAGDYDGAALEFHRWNRSNGKVLPGLVRRRAAEALLFQAIADLDFDGKPDPMPQSVALR
jgi:lysozyme